MPTCARPLAGFLRLGPRAVIVKGGHLTGDTATDLLVSTSGETALDGPRLHVASTHGTGCTFASAIAARLAIGDTLEESARRAKAYVAGAMRRGIAVGDGHQPLDHFWQTR